MTESVLEQNPRSRTRVCNKKERLELFTKQNNFYFKAISRHLESSKNIPDVCKTVGYRVVILIFSCGSIYLLTN